MNTDWKDRLHEIYRKKFGCKNIGKVCWCEICVNIETLIKDTIKEVKQHIPDLFLSITPNGYGYDQWRITRTKLSKYDTE